MKVVSIGYSKVKLGLWLCMLAFMAAFPIWVFAAMPGIFSIEGKSISDISLIYGIIFGGALLGLGLLVLNIKKYIASNEAVLLSQDGVWSNVSGIGEKLIPWSQVEQAKVLQNHNSFAVIKVALKETEEEHAQRSRFSKFVKPKHTMVIWPITLEKCAFNLADIINEYTEHYNAVVTEAAVEKPVIQPLDKHVGKAA